MDNKGQYADASKNIRYTHLTCNICQSTFCLYCRQEFTSMHFNLYSPDGCKFLRQITFNSWSIKRENIGERAYNDIPIKNSHIFPIVTLILLLWMIFGPLLSLIIVPYLGLALAKQYFKASSNCFKISTVALLIILLPILGPVTYILVFGYLATFYFWSPRQNTKMKNKKLNNKVIAGPNH
jgi:hypothetical protein